MRKLFKERKLFKGGNYMRKYGIWIIYQKNGNLPIEHSRPKEFLI